LYKGKGGPTGGPPSELSRRLRPKDSAATKLPAKSGYEASGVVTAIGADVDPTWLNKSVSTILSFSLNQYGVLGDEAIVPAHAVAEYPGKLNFERTYGAEILVAKNRSLLPCRQS